MNKVFNISIKVLFIAAIIYLFMTAKNGDIQYIYANF